MILFYLSFCMYLLIFLEALYSSDMHYLNSLKKQGPNANSSGAYRQLQMAIQIKDSLEEIEFYKRTFFSPVTILI